MEDAGGSASRRPVIRLERPASSRARRRDGAPDLVLSFPRQGPSRTAAVSGLGTRTAAEHLRSAMTQAAVALGDEEISQGLTAAQVLEGRQTLRPGGVLGRRVGVATAEAASTSSSWRSRLSWLSSRLNFSTLGLLLMVIMFPRLLAFLVAMGVRLVASLLVRLSSRIIRELVMQIALLAADVESQVIDWLYNAWLEAQAPTTVVLPLSSSPSPPAPSVTSPTPPQTVTVALPARPMDYLTLFLSLHISGLQVSLLDNIRKYVKPDAVGFEAVFTGQMLCLVALVCWYLMVAKEINHALALHRGIMALPRGQKSFW
ncbi:hypothetical protein AK812_SmicGene42202 [Symbiodinium microadriaticum]|uniref:Uncharacterized protein n=1 Tax=Symbiodinium microadriaticum TaxID=2951 RepID=A0A1Q9C464_SYMMI|nr:hypothetical protein AK812_SmicGene42202 [Symbiodinium microadriaticum]